MTTKLRPYSNYRDTELPWLGPIPTHWSILRAKYVFREMDERSQTGSETHLTMSQKHGLIASSKVDNQTLKSESYAGGKLCIKDDLVLNPIPFNGA